MTYEEKIFQKYGPQIGEVVWHTFTNDPSVMSMSQEDYCVILNLINDQFTESSSKDLKVLELCSNNHVTGYLLKDKLDCQVTVLDISKHALLDGKRIANSHGLCKKVSLCHSDFHSLPFDDETFDLVYIFRALHHTKTPEFVFNEVNRVLKKGGIFSLNLEPFKRELCTFSFKTNRKEELSSFERALLDFGILGFLSYPTAGSRPEDLFFMTENGEIPLGFYLKNYNEHFKILSTRLMSKELTQFEKQLVEKQLDANDSLYEFSVNYLKDSLDKAHTLLGEKEKHMGFKIPSREVIEALAGKIALELKNFALSSVDQGFKYHSFFGGEISVDYRKVSSLLNNSPDAICKLEEIDFSKPLLPDIQENQSVELAKIFPNKYWSVILDAGNAISILNKGSYGTIKIPFIKSQAVIAGRFYGIDLDEPYRVIFSCSNNKIAEITVCRSETRFFRKVGKFDSDIEILIVDMEGNPLNIPEHFRLGVLQMFELKSP